jgi:chromosome partitioning protein
MERIAYSLTGEAGVAQAEVPVGKATPIPASARGPHPRPRVVGIVNRKGGVGKTTTAFNLAGALAERGRQVLVVDLDPMGSLCRSIKIRPERKTLSDLLVGLGGSLGDLIRRTEIPNLFVVPGDPNLRTFEMRHGGSVEYRDALKRNLAEVLRWKPFPFVIIDCPPSLGLISGNALTASDEVIIPVDGSTYGMGALVDTLRVVKLIQGNVNPDLRVLGLVLNNVDLGTAYDRTVLDVLRQQYPGLVFDTVIPNSPESDLSAQMGQPVVRYAPQSWMAKAYRQLIQEILARRPDSGR